MGGIDIDHVETRIARPQSRLAVPAAQVLYVRLVHRAGLKRVACQIWQAGNIHRGQPGIQVRTARTAVPQFGPRERPMFVHLVGHQPIGANVAVVPKRRMYTGQVIRGWMDRIVFSANHAPPPFRFDTAHRGEGAGAQKTHAGAMRHLEKAVFGGDRPDFDGLEQDVITRITGHIGRSVASCGNSRRNGAVSGCGTPGSRA